MAKTKKTAAQLDREIKEALQWGKRGGRGRGARAPRGLHHVSQAEGKTPLYGHTSESSAYVVDDYPYGFRERTKIRYWLEHKPKKGWRFMSQTLNPKTQRWNKPKASTYTDWGAAMYLDDKGHVQWEGVGAYSDGEKILAFVRAFPEASMSELRKVAPAKLKLLRGLLSGDLYFTINKERSPMTEKDAERHRKDLETWEEINVYLDHAA